MKLKTFQRQDLARAALHDGLILSWDTGLGKTWALYLWPLLKVGYHQEPLGHAPYFPPKVAGCKLHVAGAAAQNLQPSTSNFQPATLRLRPLKPVLIIAPGDLHQQIVDEGWERFGIAVCPLDSQAAFNRLCRSAHRATSNLDAQGRPIVPPDFYITSYTQLTTNGVERLPDALDHENPLALREKLCLKDGPHVATSAIQEFCQEKGFRWPSWDKRPFFGTTSEFFAWRQICWADSYQKFGLTAEDATTATLNAAYEAELEKLSQRRDPEQAEKERVALLMHYETLKMLVTAKPDPEYHALAPAQRIFVLRHFLDDFIQRGGEGDGGTKTWEKLSDGSWRKYQTPDSKLKTQNSTLADAPTVVTTWKIKCCYSPSLSDLCYNAFRGVAIDEGVKMKGADTYVGAGVRQMDPEYRLVLTATPVKNRVPDVFWLAHWATGGKDEAHARFPYSSDSAEQTKFAETFMVSEHNLTKEANAAEKGSRSQGRFKKLTAEVCNVHRLWKLLGPILLRRRKDDCGEDIPPKIRRVVRCKMGTLQAKAYAYHLTATYKDKNGDDAIGARLQSLRMAAADPSSLLLPEKPGGAFEDCECTRKPVPADEQCKRLNAERAELVGRVTPCAPSVGNTRAAGKGLPALPEDEAKATRERMEAIDHELANPIQRYDTIPAKKDCKCCRGAGEIALPHRSGQAFIPKHASVLNLVHEILARGEQVVIGSAFNDPLDRLATWLDEAGVRHLKLDGRTSQKKRGTAAALFKRGRVHQALPPQRPAVVGQTCRSAGDMAIPVMLAGVECMAEGHSFDKANNVILLAYSWAYDKFIQFINRVHRMTSAKPVNVYVVICDGTIDRRLESLIGEKGDSSELVLDGRLIGERTEEVNLAELLKVAHREFDSASDTLDEALCHAQWPKLRESLRTAMQSWDGGAAVVNVPPVGRVTPCAPKTVRSSKPVQYDQKRDSAIPTTSLRYDPVQKKYVMVTVTPLAELPPPPAAGGLPRAARQSPVAARPEPPAPVPAADWRSVLQPKPRRLMVVNNDPWKQL
jgi:hypothetical protein